MSRFFFVALIFLICGCANGVKNSGNMILSLSIDHLSSFRLVENDTIKIGKVDEVCIDDSSRIWIADAISGKVFVYDTLGNIIHKFLSKGEGPGEIYRPVGISVSPKHFVILESFSSIKFFHRHNGRYIRQIFLKENQYGIIHGTIKILNDNLICISINDNNLSHPLILVDTIGNIVSKFGEFPIEYKDYILPQEQRFDVNRQGLYAVCFSQSPAIWIGKPYAFDKNLHSFSDFRYLYISPKRKRETTNSSENISLISSERFNTKLFWINDSLIAVSSEVITEESMKKRIFSLREHFLTFFCINQNSFSVERIQEFKVKGRIQGKVSENTFLIEESDEPDNRRFGLYKINIEPVK